MSSRAMKYAQLRLQQSSEAKFAAGKQEKGSGVVLELALQVLNPGCVKGLEAVRNLTFTIAGVGEEEGETVDYREIDKVLDSVRFNYTLKALSAHKAWLMRGNPNATSRQLIKALGEFENEDITKIIGRNVLVGAEGKEEFALIPATAHPDPAKPPKSVICAVEDRCGKTVFDGGAAVYGGKKELQYESEPVLLEPGDEATARFVVKACDKAISMVDFYPSLKRCIDSCPFVGAPELTLRQHIKTWKSSLGRPRDPPCNPPPQKTVTFNIVGEGKTATSRSASSSVVENSHEENEDVVQRDRNGNGHSSETSDEENGDVDGWNVRFDNENAELLGPLTEDNCPDVDSLNLDELSHTSYLSRVLNMCGLTQLRTAAERDVLDWKFADYIRSILSSPITLTSEIVPDWREDMGYIAFANRVMALYDRRPKTLTPAEVEVLGAKLDRPGAAKAPVKPPTLVTSENLPAVRPRQSLNSYYYMVLSKFEREDLSDQEEDLLLRKHAEAERASNPIGKPSPTSPLTSSSVPIEVPQVPKLYVTVPGFPRPLTCDGPQEYEDLVTYKKNVAKFFRDMGIPQPADTMKLAEETHKAAMSHYESTIVRRRRAEFQNLDDSPSETVPPATASASGTLSKRSQESSGSTSQLGPQKPEGNRHHLQNALVPICPSSALKQDPQQASSLTPSANYRTLQYTCNEKEALQKGRSPFDAFLTAPQVAEGGPAPAKNNSRQLQSKNAPHSFAKTLAASLLKEPSGNRAIALAKSQVATTQGGSKGRVLLWDGPKEARGSQNRGEIEGQVEPEKDEIDVPTNIANGVEAQLRILLNEIEVKTEDEVEIKREEEELRNYLAPPPEDELVTPKKSSNGRRRP